MKLEELSEGYLAAAEALRRELRSLRASIRSCKDPERRSLLRSRVAAQAAVLTQVLVLAELTAHYYERGFYRDERYTL